MGNCRKCGAKHITRRRAGVFSCRHCGVQPGPQGFNLDRAGNPLITDTGEGPVEPGSPSSPMSATRFTPLPSQIEIDRQARDEFIDKLIGEFLAWGASVLIALCFFTVAAAVLFVFGVLQ